MTFQQRKLILDSFAISHLFYCPSGLKFHSRRLNNRISNIHERALRTIYHDYTTSFSDLLAQDTSLTIYHRNLRKLVTEMFKVKVGIAPEIM